MGGRAGLRRTTYQGPDQAAEQALRGVNDTLNFLENLPTTDGVVFYDIDFSSFKSTSTRTYPLKHTLNRKARGVLAIGCRPRQFDSPNVVGGLPTHVPQQDTNSIAYVCLSADMAADFVWNFWVY